MTDNAATASADQNGARVRVATDDIEGVHYQRVKVTHGADGTATDTSSAAPLPVTLKAADLAALALDVTLQAVRDRLGEIAASPTANTVADRLKQVKSAVDAAETARDADATTAQARLDLLASETKLEAVRALLAGTLAISAASLPLPAGAASEATMAKRFAGGKLAKTAQVTAAGDTTIHTPATGKRVRLYWVSAINDPDASQAPRIIVKFGAGELYRAYAIAHWEIFDGAIDQPLVVNLDQSGDVAVTIHYEEI